jgi:hypothetical protein
MRVNFLNVAINTLETCTVFIIYANIFHSRAKIPVAVITSAVGIQAECGTKFSRNTVLIIILYTANPLLSVY